MPAAAPTAATGAATPRGGGAGGGSSSSSLSVLDGRYTGGLPSEVTAAVAAALPTSDPLDRPVRVCVHMLARMQVDHFDRLPCLPAAVAACLPACLPPWLLSVGRRTEQAFPTDRRINPPHPTPTNQPINHQQQDFDAVEYINAKFASCGSSEQALDEALDPFIAQVTGEIGAFYSFIYVWPGCVCLSIMCGLPGVCLSEERDWCVMCGLWVVFVSCVGAVGVFVRADSIDSNLDRIYACMAAVGVLDAHRSLIQFPCPVHLCLPLWL